MAQRVDRTPAAALEQHFQHNIAVVIGINDYEHVRGLKTAQPDAEYLASLLRDDKQRRDELDRYKLFERYDEEATFEAIHRLLTEILPAEVKKAGPHTRVIFYFAGHGDAEYTDNTIKGYLFPQDAQPREQDEAQRKLLPMAEVQKRLAELDCRHVLIILDCCSAGAMAKESATRSALLPPPLYWDTLQRYVGRKARQVITSAAHNQKASDVAPGYNVGERDPDDNAAHSPFALAFFEALAADPLQGRDLRGAGRDGVVTATELYLSISDSLYRQVGEAQTPGLWTLSDQGHDQGDFVFLLPGARVVLEPAPDLTGPEHDPWPRSGNHDLAQALIAASREAAIRDLIRRVEAWPLVAVTGRPHSGKTSLVSGMLLPRLSDDAAAGSNQGKKRWQVLSPLRLASPAPVQGLADHVRKALGLEAVDSASEAVGWLTALVAAWAAGNPDRRLLLAVDCDEALFDAAPAAERARLWALLGEAAQPDVLHIVLTVSSDRWEVPAQADGQDSQPLLPSASRYEVDAIDPFNRDGLRQVIEQPAAAKMIFLESDTLIARLLDAVDKQPAALPLLTETLHRMYMRHANSIKSGVKDPRDRTLTQAYYEAEGGVAGVVADLAEQLYCQGAPGCGDASPGAHQQSMQHVLMRLVAVENGRYVCGSAALSAFEYSDEGATARAQAIIGEMTALGLAASGVGAEGQSLVELGHIALIEAWPRMQGWLVEKGAEWALQRQLTARAAEWQPKQAKPLLWDDDPRLPQVEETLWPTGAKQKGLRGRLRWARQVLAPKTDAPADTKWLNGAELRFVQTSVTRRASTFRRIIGIIAAVMIALTGLTIFASYQANQATQQRNVAVTAEAKAVSESNARATEVIVRSTAEANAQVSAKAAATAAADARLKQAEAEREARRAKSGELAVYAQTAIIDYKHDPSLALILAKQAVETTWLAPEHMAIANASKALQAALDAAPPYIMTLPRHRHNGMIMSVGYSPDSKLIVTAGSDATARIWNAGTGEEALILIGHDAAVLSAAFSPNGKTVVTASADRTVRIWVANDGKSLLVLNGHADVINSARYSGDGRLIVTASDDGTARIWDATTGQQLRLLRGHTREVKLATFSPDGRLIVTASNDSTARIWEEGTGKEVRTLRGSEFEVTSAVYSPDGQFVVSAGYDSTARIWDAATGEKLHELDDHTQPITSVAFSPDSNYIVTASGDGTARVWDAATGQEVRQLDDDALWLHQAAYSPDGTSIITAGANGTARIWDAATGQLARQLGGHAGPVASAAYSPDGKFIVTAGEDQTVRVWDAIRGDELRQLRGHDCLALSVVFRHCRASSAEFSPDGAFIVASGTDGTARIWNATTGEEVRQFSGHGAALYSATYSRDGKLVLTAGDDGIARIWDAASGEELRQLIGHAGPVNSARYSPDGMSILTAGDDRTARIWDAATGQEQNEITGHAASLNRAAYSPDGRLIVTASNDNTARIWDAVTGQEIRQLSGHSQDCPESHICSVLSAAFSPDGLFIVTGSADDTVFVWDAATGQEVRRLRGHIAPVLPAGISASYSPDGTRIVTASDDGTARIWSVTKLEEVHKLGEPPKWLNPAAYSPDGRYAAHTSGRDVWITDVATGKEVHRLAGHTDEVQSAAFSPDGRFIVTASFALPSSLDSNTLTGPDGVVRIWDAATGEEVRQLNGHGCVNYFCGVNSALFDSDGTLIVTAGADSTARIWDAATGVEVRRLVGHRCADITHCKVLSAQFSPDGEFIITAGDDSTARIWDAATGKELHRLTINRRDRVNSAAYSPDGLFIVTASADGVTRVWDASTGQELRELNGYDSQIYKAAYSPDGSQIAFLGERGTSFIWDVGIDGQLALATRLIQRDPPLLTPEERRLYGLE